MSDITTMVNIRNFLLSDSNITSLVGQKIFFSDLYSIYNDLGEFSSPAFHLDGINPFPTLIVKLEEGPGNIYLKEFPTVFYAYSNLFLQEAYNIIQAVHDRVFSNENPFKVVFSPSGSPSDGYDKKLRLYYVYLRVGTFVTC